MFPSRQMGTSRFKAMWAVAAMIGQWEKKPDAVIVITGPTENFNNLDTYKEIAKVIGYDMTFSEPKKIKRYFQVTVTIRREDATETTPR